jgi:hypothetical protein
MLQLVDKWMSGNLPCPGSQLKVSSKALQKHSGDLNNAKVGRWGKACNSYLVYYSDPRNKLGHFKAHNKNVMPS